MFRISAGLGLMVAVLGVGCAGGGSPMPATASDRRSLSMDVAEELGRFRGSDPSLKKELDKAVGYALLPDVGKGAFILGGAYGRGEVFERGKRVGYCDLTQGTIGPQIGGQSYSELIIFKDKLALERFKRGDGGFSANATAVAVKPGAAALMNYSDGVAVLIHIKGGLMAEASIGGQKFSFVPSTASVGTE